MVLYLYALADGLTEVGGLAGLENEPLILGRAEQAIAVGGWLTQPPALDRITLLAQDRIVRELHARAAALLPMRFGVFKADVASVQRAIDLLGRQVRARLDLVSGREQMTLRVLGATSATGATGATGAVGAVGAVGATGAMGAGARYLADRTARATPRAVAPILDALRAVQRETRVEVGRQPGVVATVYQLIDRGTSDSYRRLVADSAATLPELTVRISGPAPAYAFADIAAP